MNIAKKLFYLVPAFLFICFNAAGATLNADFTISSYTKKCQDSSFVFDASTATSYTGSGTLSYAWDFGDTTSGSNAAKQTKKYSHEGTFKVRLIVTSSDGLKDTAIKDVEVYPVPKANFTFPTKLCQRTEVAFTDSSLVSSTGYIDKYLWTFDAGKTSSSSSPIVNLNEA
jgi:PKD repeat protein